MDEAAPLTELADLLEHAASAMQQFVRFAQGPEPMLPQTCLDASQLARELLSRPCSELKVAGKDMSHAPVTGGMLLLQLVLRVRTGCMPSSGEIAAASHLAKEMLEAAKELRVQAAEPR